MKRPRVCVLELWDVTMSSWIREHFYLFVIQGPAFLARELRLDKYPLNVLDCG